MNFKCMNLNYIHHTSSWFTFYRLNHKISIYFARAGVFLVPSFQTIKMKRKQR